MIPREEIRQRISALQNRIVEERLDGALIVYAVDVYYFSGTFQNAALWVPSDGSPILLVRKSFSRAREESALDDVRPFPPSRDLPSLFAVKSRRIGMTFDVLPVQHYNFYRNLFREHEFVDISGRYRDMRSVKSAWELEQMKMSGSRLAEAFDRVPEVLSPGMREIDLAAGFENVLRKSGIGGYLRIRGFNQEITGLAAAGECAAVAGCFDGPVTGRGQWTAAPYGPSAEAIRAGDPIIVDYGGFYNGYITDMTRIFSFGRLEHELERAYAVSLEIQDWIKANLRPGSICEDIFNGAAHMAAAAGLGDYFMGHPGEPAKFVGHGVGLELDELPVLAQKFKEPLRTGQTIAVEPKFLFPGRGAIGIENTFAVTEAGCEQLTNLPDAIVYL